MNPRPKNSEEKLTPTLSIGVEKKPADPTGWTPKRQGEGVYTLLEGDRTSDKRTLNTNYEVQEGGKRQGSYVILALGVLTLVAILFMTIWLLKKQAGLRAASAHRETDPSRVLQVSDDVIVGLTAKDWKGALPREAAKGFVYATTTAERLRYVRNPEANAKILAEFFESGPGSREKLSSLEPIRSISTLEMVAEEFQADFVEGPSRVVCVVLENDMAKVDFKCYARHNSVDFAKLLDGTVTRADEVCLVVSASEPYYNFAFSDDSQWVSFASQSPDLPVNLLLYARIGSAAEREMSDATKYGALRLIMSIESKEDSHKNRQFEVTKVLSRLWVEPTAARSKNAK